MLIGPFINGIATISGGLIGAIAGKYIPRNLKEKLPLTFGLIAFSIGLPLVVQMTQTLIVVLSLLLGVIIGELLQLEKLVEKLAWKSSGLIDKLSGKKEMETKEKDEFIEQFIVLLVLFSASGFGILGAMNEGISGDRSMLSIKAILDFFTAIIFGTSFGYLVCLAAVPQVIVMLTLYFLGAFILPLTTPDMLANFQALGGIIMLATGFSITKIKTFSTLNMLPGLILLIPLYLLLQ